MLDCFNTRVRASDKARARRAAQARTPMPTHGPTVFPLLVFLIVLCTLCIHVFLSTRM